MRLAPVVLCLGVLFAAPLVEAATTTYSVRNRRIEPNQPLAVALQEAGLPPEQVSVVISALEGVFDFRKSRVGDQFRLVLREGELDFFDYRQSAVDEWQVRRDGDRFVGSKRSIEVEKQVAVVSLEVSSSLYEAALAAGEDPLIGMVLADVFAWDIDFYRDVRRGDRARAVVEKFLSKGRFLRYGEVLAASYQGESVGQKRVFRYELPDGKPSFFQEDGASARKAFLKSPLKYAHVTSTFGSRFHPVLQYVKAHNGVDYAASVGTPVWAVADGTVTLAANTGAGGNTVCLRHSNGFETCYLHLSRFGQGVRAGARVSQKQVIALSGNTGRSTGPHLHYALKRNGHYVNPLNQNFPRTEPLPKSLLADFRAKVAPLAQQLDAVSVAQASAGD
ncbi:peptidoglycan DD-metalloendopeptidase family protein [Cystobacter ferrugineus]|uniref:Peptidase M23 n=1 Tax=Cystobacter ferrugineus TaxID=83449 RepID=A0A1L9AZM2_9BACT|nr:peptidoglycan DD-metalloendopeptidase family protein [Cystobacter ferrugineus]OJH35459.1 peptidase M23 [Cystobacter ferrugineus]